MPWTAKSSLAWNNGTSDSVAVVCNVCNTICAVSSVRAICSDAGRASARCEPTHSTRLALSKERTSSAPALITARRRSYFTPRSSIIHAVNNAPLFRVTLYPGLLPTPPSFYPSFLPAFPPSIPSFRLSSSLGCESVPCDSGARGRGVRAVSVRDTLLSPDLSTETRHGPLVPEKLALWPALYSILFRGRSPRNRRDDRGKYRICF